MANHAFTAVYKKTGKWFSAWVEEIPGVNTQGRTKKEALENLKEALLLVLAANREISDKQNRRGVFRELFTIRVPA
ncbi:MAG: type II toxin-antitoxin system HicB family antitoxin [Patescibacteria group bacterium]